MKKKTKKNDLMNIHVSKLKLPKVKKLNLEGLTPYKSSLDLSDHKKVKSYLVEFFEDGEHEAFMDLLELYIDHIGKRRMAKLTEIPERSIYNFKDKTHKTSAENIFRIMKVIGEMAA
jgi:DNA-binding phage protein